MLRISINLSLITGILFLGSIAVSMQQQPKKKGGVDQLKIKRPIDRKLFEAIDAGDLNAVRTALTGGANVNVAEDEIQATPLHQAITTGDEAIFRELLNRGGDPSARAKKGVSLLHHAAGVGRDAMIRELLSRGIRVDVTMEDGSTPLHLAAGLGRLATVRLLLERGANVNALTANNKTPINNAVFQGGPALGRHNGPIGEQESTIRLLLDRGANPNIAQENGTTPLHWAVVYEAENIVRLLLDRGADIEAVTNEDETALRFAIAGGYRELVQLLMDRGARVTDAHVVFANEQNEPEIAALLRPRITAVNRAPAVAAALSSHMRNLNLQ